MSKKETELLLNESMNIGRFCRLLSVMWYKCATQQCLIAIRLLAT